MAGCTVLAATSHVSSGARKSNLPVASVNLIAVLHVLLQFYLRFSSRQLPAMYPQELASVIWSFARLKVRLPDPWLVQYCQAVQTQLKKRRRVQVKTAVNMLFGLARQCQLKRKEWVEAKKQLREMLLGTSLPEQQRKQHEESDWEEGQEQEQEQQDGSAGKRGQQQEVLWGGPGNSFQGGQHQRISEAPRGTGAEDRYAGNRVDGWVRDEGGTVGTQGDFEQVLTGMKGAVCGLLELLQGQMEALDHGQLVDVVLAVAVFTGAQFTQKSKLQEGVAAEGATSSNGNTREDQGGVASLGCVVNAGPESKYASRAFPFVVVRLPEGFIDRLLEVAGEQGPGWQGGRAELVDVALMHLQLLWKKEEPSGVVL